MSKINCRVIAVDLDGVLVENLEFWKGFIGKPIQKNIDIVNQLYDGGDVIIIYTSRREVDRDITEFTLKKYKVKYHCLVMEKLPADIYLDDKALNSNEIEKLCENID
jgi:hypothetical protein